MPIADCRLTIVLIRCEPIRSSIINWGCLKGYEQRLGRFIGELTACSRLQPIDAYISLCKALLPNLAQAFLESYIAPAPPTGRVSLRKRCRGCSTIGRHDEAIERFRRAQDLDPLTLQLKVSLGWAYVCARQYDQAIAQFRNILELDPRQFEARSGLGTAYVLKGMHEAGIAECQKALDLSGELGERATLGWAYAMGGRHGDEIKIVDDLKSDSKQKAVLPHVSMAKIYGALGEKDLAMEELELAYSKRDSQGILWLKVDPTFDSLRPDPRFKDLLLRIGFPP